MFGFYVGIGIAVAVETAVGKVIAMIIEDRFYL